MDLNPNSGTQTQKKRDEINPDPFAKRPTVLPRNPGRAEPKQVVLDSTRPTPRIRSHVHSSSATQSIPNNVATVITLALNPPPTDFDTVGLFTPSRFTIPTTGKVTGPWQIHGRVTYAAAAAGARHLHLRQNGTTLLVDDHEHGTNDDQSLEVLILVNDPVPGTYYELIALQDSGGPLNILTGPEETFFEIIHLW